MALLNARGFSADDFALSHPGGALGRRLLLRVADLMRKGAQLPQVQPDTPLHEAILEISGKGMGMTTVVDAENHLLGIFTDGDLRRAFTTQQDLWGRPMADFYRPQPLQIAADALAAEAVARMDAERVTVLLIVDAAGRLEGAITMHDLLHAGVA